MELSNRDLVGKGFELLAEGLEPFVERHLAAMVPGGMDWLDWLSRRGQNRTMTQSKSDPLVLLRAINDQEKAFKGALSRTERSYVQELWECRNNWAHNSVFNEADTHRLLDTIERLLRAIAAVTEADEVQRLLRENRRPAAQRPSQQAPHQTRGQERANARTTPGSRHDGLFPRSGSPGGSMLPAGSAMAVASLGVAIFAALAIVGLVVLPSASAAEKALIIGACLALSIAALAGVAAWRNIRRFIAMAIAGGLAIACLAGLSITASGASPEQPRTLGRPLSPSSSTDHGQAVPVSPDKPSTSASPVPTASVSQATSGSSQYLTNLSGDSGDSYTPQSGSWIMGGRTYANSIGYPAVYQSQSVTYQLNGSYRNFVATVGVNDDADPLDQGTPVEFTVYGNPKGGPTMVLKDITTQWGSPETINVQVGGATTLTLNTSSGGLISSSSIAVWGNAELIS